MISLMLALLASPAANGQAVQAQLQSCALENNRYVCRYAVPDIVIVPVQGTNITADAPAAVLGSAPSAEGSTTTPSSSAGVSTWSIPMAEGHSSSGSTTTIVPTPAPPTPARPTPAPPAAAVEPGPIHPIDAGVLTEREAQLVDRCADAGWLSLCLPADRRSASTLRDKQAAYLAVRREVSRLIADSRCDAAVRTALDGGYLSMARETREYCAAATAAAAATATRPPVIRTPAPRAVPAPPANPARPSVLPELETKAANPSAS